MLDQFYLQSIRQKMKLLEWLYFHWKVGIINIKGILTIIYSCLASSNLPLSCLLSRYSLRTTIRLFFIQPELMEPIDHTISNMPYLIYLILYLLGFLVASLISILLLYLSWDIFCFDLLNLQSWFFKDGENFIVLKQHFQFLIL